MSKLIDGLTDVLDEVTYEEIDELIGDIKSYSKKRQVEAKDAIAADARAKLNKGDEVLVKYKDTKVSGIVTRVGDKTFTVEIEDEYGESKKVPRMYHFYLSHVEKAEEAA